MSKCKLSADKTNYDLMRATFPAGTVSGAPKIRAMQISADLEGTTHGPYGGCVGYFSFRWGERPREPARQQPRPTKPAEAGSTIPNPKRNFRKR